MSFKGNSLIKKDYILLIFNCVKYKHKALMQKNTWLKELFELNNKDNITVADNRLTVADNRLTVADNRLTYFHVLGDPNLEQDFLINAEQQILWIKVADDYNSLPKKVIQAYEAITKLFHFKYIFKTDDDQMVSPIKFFNTLMNILDSKYSDPVFANRVHYGGHIVDVKHAYNSQYYKLHPELPTDLIVKQTQYCSGRFYLLSHNVVDFLILKKYAISNEFLEDYAIGFHMPTSGFKDKIMNINTSVYFKDIDV